MARGLSAEQVEQLRIAFQQSGSIRKAAAICGISKSSAERYLKGTATPTRRVGLSVADYVDQLEAQLAAIRQQIAQLETVVAVIKRQV